MLNQLEQDEVLRLADRLRAAALVAERARRSALYRTTPKKAEQNLEHARETLRDYLKEVG